MSQPTDEELREAVAKVRTIPYVRNIPVDLENALDAVLASLEEARKDSASLLGSAQKLASLLNEPEPGLFTWQELTKAALEELNRAIAGDAKKDSAPLLTGRLISIGDSVLNGESVTGVFIEVHRSNIANLKYAPLYQDVTIAAAATSAEGEA